MTKITSRRLHPLLAATAAALTLCALPASAGTYQ